MPQNSFCLGFTGTQRGATKAQIVALRAWLLRNAGVITAVRQGCCAGADATFAALCAGKEFGGVDWPDGCKPVLHAHPPVNEVQLSGMALAVSDVKHPPKEYLDRNRDIVDLSHALLACPSTFEEVLRSGTWATVRHARKVGKPVLILYPDGNIRKE